MSLGRYNAGTKKIPIPPLPDAIGVRERRNGRGRVAFGGSLFCRTTDSPAGQAGRGLIAQNRFPHTPSVAGLHESGDVELKNAQYDVRHKLRVSKQLRFLLTRALRATQCGMTTD